MVSQHVDIDFFKNYADKKNYGSRRNYWLKTTKEPTSNLSTAGKTKHTSTPRMIVRNKNDTDQLFRTILSRATQLEKPSSHHIINDNKPNSIPVRTKITIAPSTNQEHKNQDRTHYEQKGRLFFESDYGIAPRDISHDIDVQPTDIKTFESRIPQEHTVEQDHQFHFEEATAEQHHLEFEAKTTEHRTTQADIADQEFQIHLEDQQNNAKPR